MPDGSDVVGSAKLGSDIFNLNRRSGRYTRRDESLTFSLNKVSVDAIQVTLGYSIGVSHTLDRYVGN